MNSHHVAKYDQKDLVTELEELKTLNQTVSAKPIANPSFQKPAQTTTDGEWNYKKINSEPFTFEDPIGTA